MKLEEVLEPNRAFREQGPLQPEPFLLREVGDGYRGGSLVIPLPRGRALRIGVALRAWCKIGPRRYRLIATEPFVDDWVNLCSFDGTTPEEAKQRLRDHGMQIQGELEAVDGDR